MAFPIRHRLANVLIDAGLVALAWYAAFFFRFEELPVWAEKIRDEGLWRVVLIKVVVFIALGLYSRWWRYVSLRDLFHVVRACVAASVLVVLALELFPDVDALPRGVIAFDFVFTLLALIAARALARTIFERPRPGFLLPTGREVLVIGAGEAGQLVVREMLKKRALGYSPTRLLDDDPRKQGMRLEGVRVEGKTTDLDEILESSPPDEVVIAMPGAEPGVRQRIVDVCRRRGVPVKTVPGVNELLDGDLDLLERLRAVQVEDVLGRAPVQLDLAAIGGYLTGRTVLVTGAGGSIGSELCRQIGRLSPHRLVLVDHAEDNLFEVERSLHERGMTGGVPIIADVKDTRRMAAILEQHAPTVLFHAAAYKHVPMMESNPAEAIRNNSLATRDLAELARDAGIERFVLISTDKAVDPSTIMGSSKALCESVMEAAAQAGNGTRFIAVRFGNVLGSSGSVIPIFQRQIAAGGPVTVTDPRMTRYFMTIPEAAQLVVQAGGVGQTGDVFVLDMGDPVRIVDLAHDMIRLSGKEPDVDNGIRVQIVGVRPGEKLDEKLFADDEHVEITHHNKLRRARRGPIDGAWLSSRLAQIDLLLASGRDEEAVELALDTAQAPVRGRLGQPARDE
jgi:FlaA1/EpsC-like NDP-sugar epimerase